MRHSVASVTSHAFVAVIVFAIVPAAAVAAETAPVPAAAATTGNVIRVRAYVEESFGKGAEADAKIAAAFDGASAIFSKDLGASLKLVDKKAWKPKSPAAPKNVRAGLVELETTDTGADVDVVVAFIGAPPAATDDFHKLGLAHELGKHAIVRRVDDAHEAAVVLAHQIAHVIGGVHVENGDDVLSAKYVAKQTDFLEDSAAILKLGVEHRLAKSEKDRGSAAARLGREAESRKAKLESDSLSALRDSLEDLASTASSEVVLPKEQANSLNDAVASINAGDIVGGWKKLRPLADAKDASTQVLVMACRAVSLDKLDEPDAQARCDRALAASPDDLDTANAAVRVALKKKDDATLKRSFAEAKARLARVKVPGPDVDELAALAQGSGRISIAEDALAKSTMPKEQLDKLKQKLLNERRRAGLPRGALGADDEAAFLDVLQSISVIKEPADQITAVDKAVKRFGEVPGLSIARADAQFGKERYRDAEATAEKALAKYDEAVLGHVIAGMAYDKDSITPKALVHLEKALELDPDYEGTYAPLAHLYHQVGKRDLQKKLETTYQQKFGKPLVRGASDF